jgi:hypothetical protein
VPAAGSAAVVGFVAAATLSVRKDEGGAGLLGVGAPGDGLPAADFTAALSAEAAPTAPVLGAG